MLRYLKQASAMSLTENGALTYRTSGSDCLDLFFRAGAMRAASEDEIRTVVLRAFAEDPVAAMRILFYVRDVRGGLGERRFFRIGIRALADQAPDRVARNIAFFAEYGRWDDVVALMGTACRSAAMAEIDRQLRKDIAAMDKGEDVSLLAKWLPSANASSQETRRMGRRMAAALKMDERTYRQTLSALRAYIDILENRLREQDYTFDYDSQPSCALFRYRKAFLRNDGDRYRAFLDSVQSGEKTLNASALYPYQIVRRCLEGYGLSADERRSLDLTWRSLPAYGDKEENAIAVIDGSGSMTWSGDPSIRPLDVALSLGLYFAQHSKGAFADHFITFSQTPRLIEIKGRDIVEQAQYCAGFNEVANTDLEAVFRLILDAAVKNALPQEELPSKIYVISDMEFDRCVCGGREATLFDAVQQEFADAGYALPQVVFWNVASRNSTIPVSMSANGAALVSGASPSVFDMVISGGTDPSDVMRAVLESPRYAAIQ